MRIDLNQAAQPLSESPRSSAQSATGADNRALASNAAGEDQAQLSGAHVEVQVLTTQALQFPEIRQEKVNGLRAVVSEGSYRPSSNQVAEALFAHMLVKPAA